MAASPATPSISSIGSCPPSSWTRERLNHLGELEADLAISIQAWAARASSRSRSTLPGRPTPSASTSLPAGTGRPICAAGHPPDGRVGVEVYRDIREDVTVDRLLAEVRLPGPRPGHRIRVVSGASQAFQRDATLTGRPWDELTPGMVVQACMDVAEMIRPRSPRRLRSAHRRPGADRRQAAGQPGRRVPVQPPSTPRGRSMRSWR